MRKVSVFLIAWAAMHALTACGGPETSEPGLPVTLLKGGRVYSGEDREPAVADGGIEIPGNGHPHPRN